ncbi:MAG: hypothetical protein ACPLYF_03575, partial [Fervidobacterium sp.]
FLRNKEVNGFFCVGNAGIGKSFNLIKALQERGKSFAIVKGHITALSFYRTLYENRENGILVLDDIIKLMDDKDIISLLLSALDNNKFVCWTSSSPLTSDLPRSFIFNSKIFILSNYFDEKNEFLKALKDRCIFYELSFTKEQIIEMMYILAKRKGYATEIVDYIKELSEKNVIKNLSLRLVDKLYTYASEKEWQELIKQIIEVDELKTIVFNLMKSGKSVKEQVEEFKQLTGRGRTTYFYVKAQLLNKRTEGYNY